MFSRLVTGTFSIVARKNYNEDDDEYGDMPGLQSRGQDDNDDSDDEDEEDYTYTNNKGSPGVTTCSGCTVKQPENFKDDDYS